MIDNVEKKCTGCGACANICSVNAITMGYDDCGFYTPVVDYDKCVKCGKCLNVCCALDYKSKNDFAPDVYAVAADDVTRMNCTSGGAFPVIAKWVLDNDGFVCGAAWDNEWNVQHIVIDNINDLCKLNYSKYVQSNTNNCFTQIQSLLNDNRTVLFSGTPCQNAGLLKFLDKDYSNLITVDLLCHGTPSPKVWQDYLKLNYNKSKINSINFRAKYQDWNVGTWTSIYDTNYGYIEEDKKKKQIGIFHEAFIRSILSNNACVECQYKYVPRPADFTIGDFWYFRNNTEFDSQKGLSALLLNSNKAKNIFKNIFTKFKICKKVDINNNWENLEIYKKSKDKNILFAYILDLTPEKEKAVKYVADKLNLNLKLISNMRYEGNSKLIDENNITLEDFIYYYKNADFIISDSFHGTCFSVIYEKPFISIVNSWRGYARYKIFRDMNLGSHLLESLDDIYKIEEFNLKPNFSFAKEKICQEKEKAIQWLRNALQTEMPLLDKTDLLYDYLLYTSAGIKDSNEAGKRKVKYKNIMEKVFSVKNLNLTNKKYKVITLFGVRIKISYFKHKNKVYSD